MSETTKNNEIDTREEPAAKPAPRKTRKKKSAKKKATRKKSAKKKSKKSDSVTPMAVLEEPVAPKPEENAVEASILDAVAVGPELPPGPSQPVAPVDLEAVATDESDANDTSAPAEAETAEPVAADTPETAATDEPEPVEAASPDETAEPEPTEAEQLSCAEEFEELSAQEAMDLIASIRSETQVLYPRRPRPPGSIVMPSVRVMAYESDRVDPELRVAGSTMARLYGLAREDKLDIELGRICQEIGDLASALDEVPLGQGVVILANLIGAERLLDEIFDERPEVDDAFWICYETLRGDLTCSSHPRLADMRERKRLKAIGFGPRNVIEAARLGAEAVRWRIQWGGAGVRRMAG